MWKLKIDKDIDKWVVYFTIVELLFLRWVLIGQDTLLLIFCVFLALRLFWLGCTNRLQLGNKIFLVIPLLLYIFINSYIRWNFSSELFYSNLRLMLLPMIVIIYFGYLLNARRELLKGVFDKTRPILNVYYFVNFFIILRQVGNTYFLMPIERISNTFYEDHLDGLLGLDGTHRLALFTTFLILLNIKHISDCLKEGKFKISTLICIILIILTAIYSSALNDNNMLFFLIPLFILLYYMANTDNKRGKFFKVAVVCIILIAILSFIGNSSYITDTLGSRIGSVLKNTVGLLSGGDTNDERLVYLVYALTQCGGWLFGSGFGSLKMQKDDYITSLGYNYRNWGMSDISPMIAMGGVIFYVALIWFYCCILFPDRREFRCRRYTAVIMLVFTYYHQVFTSCTMAIPMCWIIVLFALQADRVESEKLV